MSNSYKVKVNNTFEFNLDQSKISSLDAIKTEASNFHILQNNTSFKVEIKENNFLNKSYTIQVNNNNYTVAIQDNLDVLIQEMGFEVGATKKVNHLKAPMPGLILEINVKEGQEIKEDDALLILEAMKMENVLTAPRDGVIKSISANNGDAVEKNQLLIEFE
ncbi:MAG: acetyl-CoA carboxylase biotin carboxyl carrier protein subunit [Oceanihabitans sp.]